MELQTILTKKESMVAIGTGQQLTDLRPDPSSLAPYPEDYWARIVSRKCCKPTETLTAVNVIDIDRSNNAVSLQLTTLDELQLYTERQSHRDFSARVISINQSNSWRPLNVTPEMLQCVMRSTAATPEFLEIVLSFSQKNSAIEEAFSSCASFRHSKDGTETAYIFKYPVFKEKLDGGNPWSIRQTGVYHKYDLKKKSFVWIFLHPTNESPFQSRLAETLHSVEGRDNFRSHPLLFHNLLLSTYFPIWRDYMAYYEAKLLALSNIAMAARIKEPLRLTHETLTSIRFTESRFLPLEAIFRSFDKTVKSLEKLNDALSGEEIITNLDRDANLQMLNNYSNYTDAYTHNAIFLQRRTARIAQLISDTLSFKSSDTSQTQAGYMLDLTLSTVDDSTTVRVVTIVTLIYLPSTFMATVLGMNSFFEMDPSSRKLVVSPQFWIFILSSVPLTVATMLYWWWKKRRQDADRQRARLAARGDHY